MNNMDSIALNNLKIINKKKKQPTSLRKIYFADIIFRKSKKVREYSSKIKEYS